MGRQWNLTQRRLTSSAPWHMARFAGLMSAPRRRLGGWSMALSRIPARLYSTVDGAKVVIGDVHMARHVPATLSLVPRLYLTPAMQERQTTLRHFRWMLQKDILAQVCVGFRYGAYETKPWAHLPLYAGRTCSS